MSKEVTMITAPEEIEIGNLVKLNGRFYEITGGSISEYPVDKAAEIKLELVRCNCFQDMPIHPNCLCSWEPRGISSVIFNGPATIILWADGSKTIVKAQEGDQYDRRTGLAMAIAKKYLGNKGNYNDVFRKWIPEDYEPKEEPKEEPKPEPHEGGAESGNYCSDETDSRAVRRNSKIGRSKIDHGRIVALYTANPPRSVSWIADDLGCSAPTVINHLKQEGIYRGRKK